MSGEVGTISTTTTIIIIIIIIVFFDLNKLWQHEYIVTYFGFWVRWELRMFKMLMKLAITESRVSKR